MLFNQFARGVLMDPATVASGAISGVTGLVSGLIGKSAAEKAGDIQSQADQAAAQNVTATTAAANPQIGTAATNAQNLAASGAGKVVDAASNAAIGTGGAVTSANTILDPYSEAGQAAATTLQKGLTPGGTFNSTPTLQDLQIDPGYAFRLQQGQQALARSAAARGGAISGAALKDLNNYAQGSASQEYQNAFNRYETATQNRYQNLFGVANAGQQAGTTQGNNLIGGSEYQGNIQTGAAGTALGANEYAGTAGLTSATTQAANTIGAANTAANLTTSGAAAKAGGIVGGTNALTSGVTGGINSGLSAINLSRLLQNPALNIGPSGAMPPGYTQPSVANLVPSLPYSGSVAPPPPTP